jgi:Pentapeptide repeats (8 copies)
MQLSQLLGLACVGLLTAAPTWAQQQETCPNTKGWKPTEQELQTILSKQLAQPATSAANLCWADLRGAKLADANLSGANLNHANLGGADLNGANLTGAELNDSLLIKAKLNRAHLKGGHCCPWSTCGQSRENHPGQAPRLVSSILP